MTAPRGHHRELPQCVLERDGRARTVQRKEIPHEVSLDGTQNVRASRRLQLPHDFRRHRNPGGHVSDAQRPIARRPTARRARDFTEGRPVDRRVAREQIDVTDRPPNPEAALVRPEEMQAGVQE